MKKIILASNNPHKLEEIRDILGIYDILTLKDIGFDQEIVEDGYSFQENARIKVDAVRKFVEDKPEYHCAILGEDSGLCVKAINYEPGIMSARYSGNGDEANRQKLLAKLDGIQDRTAYFQCYAVLYMPTGEYICEDGKVYGLISKQKIGDESFGYDCIFWSDRLRKTFGQATIEEKRSVSHRGIAITKIKNYLQSVNYLTMPEN